MRIISFILPALLLVWIDVSFFGEDKNKKNILKWILLYGVLANLWTMFGLRYICHMDDVVSAKVYQRMAFSLKYILLVSFIGSYLLLLKHTLVDKFVTLKKSEKTSKLVIVLEILSLIIITLGFVFFFMSRWFVGEFGELTPEQFMFNLKSPTEGTAENVVISLNNKGKLPVIICTFTVLAFVLFNRDIYTKNNRKVLSAKVYKWILMPVMVIIGCSGIVYGVDKLNLRAVYRTWAVSSTFIEDNYASPNEVTLTFPEKKRNLIHIYLESVENSYLSQDLGGYMETNLMPELYELSKKGISFSNNDKMGGPHQTYGSSWSVASMVNMSAGVPLAVPVGVNAYGLDGHFLPGAITIGDILEEEGYNQSLMFGADADFGGLTAYYESHGDFHISDYIYAKEQGMIPEDYEVWWGYEDDKLYEFAKDEINRLASEGKPFNFTMETADTHFPDGYLSENAPTPYDKQYSNVIAYSTKETVDFVRWIQEQPFYDNTTIVITGDHLSMDSNYFKDFDPNYERTVFNTILNAPISSENTKNRDYAPYDFYPTIMAALGVQIEGDRLGIGTNLFSDKPTMLEEYGMDYVEKELGSYSAFYNDKLIDVNNDSIYVPKK
ncbi:phosphoglycerol transferase [Granulicatella balaenopterae]|uniref:Phosphoglycerol transferase n=1 Tax=Granulicatella balaenopterae TaxID=137733 RepID=A0A1H9M2Y9_9LACT|nr:LTA synthase family protein [Granulicatella balaenopterae]SER18031.1 phosphoglycerol transferase [Granulicatella balaenopterae]